MPRLQVSQLYLRPIILINLFFLLICYFCFQSITIQCLEALQFLHGLGLIHCDLKPENILVKSYSRCEIKVIDLGSSCFETDHLCSYVQSRSYRAPEVILGLPYDKKIDIWSLGCILAELCSGNVSFALYYFIMIFFCQVKFSCCKMIALFFLQEAELYIVVIVFLFDRIKSSH